MSTPVTPEVRAQARETALKVQSAIPAIAALVQGGKFGLTQVMLLSTILVGVATEGAKVVMLNGGAGAMAGEMLDVYSGTDPGALRLLSADFLPGMTPGECEQAFDALKPMLENVINDRVASGKAVLPPAS